MKSSRTVILKGEDFVPRKRGMLDTRIMDISFEFLQYFMINLKCGYKVQTDQLVCLRNQDSTIGQGLWAGIWRRG